MLFPRFSLNGKQEFFDAVHPHLSLLHGLALRWTGDAAEAERLLQRLLQQLPARLDDLKDSPAPRLWLVRQLHREYRAQSDWLDRDSLIASFASASPSPALRHDR